MEINSLEKLVEELKAITPFKETTDIGDVVLIASEQPRLILYAMIVSLERDQGKRQEWWHIGLTFLTVPMQNVVWTLRTEQMTGQEIFTMGGEERFIKAIDVYGDLKSRGSSLPNREKSKKGLRRIK